jgi:hypothetical protein
MPRSISLGTGSRTNQPEPAAVETGPDRDATDDEFQQAYAIEKPRWEDLADRLK